MTTYPPLTGADLDALARMGIPRTSLDLPKENTTMTDRTDHAAEALQYLEHSDSRCSEEWPVQTGEHKADVIARAQVHATLALVEQQRIANLIALSQAADGNGWQAAEPLNVVFGYTHLDPEDGFEGLHIRPEIAAALGINQEGDPQ